MRTFQILVISSLAGGILSSTSAANDFALGDWLDSKQQILAKENRVNYSKVESQQLVFKGDIADFVDSLIVYQFEKNQLKSGFFDFNQQHIIFQDHIEDFFSISDMLEKKYGVAEKKQQFWLQQSQITEREQWGNALAAGKLSLQSQWLTPNSNIILQLTSINSVIQQRLIYQPNENTKIQDTQEF